MPDKAMTPRERLLAVLERRPVDRLPVDIWFTPEIWNLLSEHTGTDDAFEVYRRLGVDKIVWVGPDYHNPDLGEADADRAQWGIRRTRVQAGMAEYEENLDPPLRDLTDPAQFDDYPWWPDPDHFDYEGGARFAKSAAAEFMTLGPWVSFFEIYCQMRGLEQALMDLMIAPEFVERALDHIERCQTEVIRRFAGACEGALDLLFLSDDMGSQSGLLLSVETWQHHFAPRMKRWCDLAHELGLRVFYHTDGASGPLVPHLIEAGIDILNPIQHVCPTMDRAELKRKHGDRVIFHGGVENQRVLPFGTADEVRGETRTCLETLGGGGQGFICCSCHNIQPGTPLENILAMIETVHDTAQATA